MSQKDLIKNNRKLLNETLRDIEQRKFFSPSTLGHYNIVAPAIKKYIYGTTLDAGCGDMPYGRIIMEKASRYDSIDIEKRASGVTFLGDIQNMDMISDESYDCVVSFEVIEHVKEPAKAISEIARVMKKGGVFIVSAPHLSRLHEEPNDFFRFTRYGFRHLLESNGFSILEIKESGGIATFLGHQISTIILLPMWHIASVRKILFFFNKWFIVIPCNWIDRFIDKKKIFALGYICVAKKV